MAENKFLFALFYTFLFLSGCGPDDRCAATQGACLDLSVLGEGRYSITLTVIAEPEPGQAVLRSASPLSDIALPAHLLVVPPPGVTEPSIRRLHVAGADPDGALQVEGQTDVTWPLSGHVAASVMLQPSTDVDLRLASLSISSGTLVPAFSPSQDTYSVQPTAPVSQAQLNLRAIDARAQVWVNEVLITSDRAMVPISLTAETTITIRLQDARGRARQYVLRVPQAPRLTALSVAGGTLSPAFAPDLLRYTVTLDTLTSQLDLRAQTDDAANTLRIDGMPVAGTDARVLIPWDLLRSPIVRVRVQAQNGIYFDYQVSVLLRPALYMKASNTGPIDQFGFCVALSGDTLAVAAPEEDSAATGINGNGNSNGATDSGAVYVFAWNGASWTQQAYLKASNTGAFDRFGYSLTLSGDTLAVGALSEGSRATGINGNGADNGATDSGAVYVFQRTAGVWAQQAYIKASNTDAGDFFGYSVALSGDTLAVGAPLESSNATGINGNQANNSAMYSGAVYVFARTAGVWAQQAYIKASNTDSQDQFGSSVALSGDTLAVGAIGEASRETGVTATGSDNTASESGAVYVFARTAGIWAQQAYLKASNTGAGDRFGLSLALAGDTLAVGAPLEDSAATGINGDGNSNAAPQSGAVYVFQRSGISWAQQAYIKGLATDAGDELGSAVALSGDLLAVSIPNDDSGASDVNGSVSNNSLFDAGSVLLFHQDAGIWRPQTYVKASNPDPIDQFGISVALWDQTLVVGAPSEDGTSVGVGGNQSSNDATSSGAAYLFR